MLVSALPAFSQEDTVSVNRSEDKVIIGGKLYYVHIVKKGQTLYSISNAYNISKQEIAKENPDVLLGLKAGQALKIPFTVRDNIQEDRVQDTGLYHYYRVKRGETLYSLSKKYQVTEAAIKKYNPILFREELKARQLIRIPKHIKKQRDKDKGRAKTISKGDYIFHRVKKEETLWRLSKEYGVEIKAIIRANDSLRDQELQTGSVIRIPHKKDKKTAVFKASSRKETPDTYDTIPSYYQNYGGYAFSCDTSDFFKRHVMDVAIFLPFYLEENQEKFYIDSSETNEQGEKIYRKVKRNPYYIYNPSEDFIKFYEGILLALDSLADKGISIRLKTFDTANDPQKLNRIIGNKRLEDFDLIIGPVYEDCFSIMADFAQKHQIPIISPLLKNRQLLEQNPYIIQVYPSMEAQLEQFASFIGKFNDKNMILVHTGDSLYYPEIRSFKSRLFNHISRDTAFGDVRFKEVAFRDSMFYLEQAMNKGEENIVIVPSENEAFVTNVVTNLNTLAKKGFDMKVFGYPQWQEFVNIELEYYYNINLYLFTSFHVNYQKERVKNVIKKYRRFFHTEPNQYTFHGFDIGYYFFNALHLFGKKMGQCLPAYDLSLCHSNYNFYKPYRDSGVENISLFILRYNTDLTIDTYDLNDLMNPILTYD